MLLSCAVSRQASGGRSQGRLWRVAGTARLQVVTDTSGNRRLTAVTRRYTLYA
jgi:hypothetical protein